MKVIIDTAAAPGDAVAVLHALTDPAFEVLAISTLDDDAAATIGRLLALARSPAPCAAAAEPPGRTDTPNGDHRAPPLAGKAPLPDAVTLLAQTLQTQPPGSVTLLALAPLSNVAQLACEHPEAYARLERIITLGSTSRTTGAMAPPEACNLRADPTAADLVLAAEVPVTLLPRDVTRQLCATPGDLARLAAGKAPAAQAAAALIADGPDEAGDGGHALHGPCVTLMAQAPVLFGCQTAQLRVDCGDRPGELLPDPARPPLRVANRIGAGSALDLLWSGLGAAPATHAAAPASTLASQSPAPHGFGQELEPAGSWPSGPGTLHRDFWPATLPDGRQLRLPIQALPGDRRRAAASLSIGQTSCAVEDALTAAMAEIWAPLAPDIMVGMPGPGLFLARALARRLGHARVVPLGTTREPWYDPALSQRFRPGAGCDSGTTIWLDPHFLPLLSGRRVLLVDDVARSDGSLTAVLRLLGRAGITPAGIATAMEEGGTWRSALPDAWRLCSVFRAPVLRRLTTGFLEE